MAARGPDFRTHYPDELPASNADIGMTIAQLLQLQLTPKGQLLGRVLTESLRGHETDLHAGHLGRAVGDRRQRSLAVTGTPRRPHGLELRSPTQPTVELSVGPHVEVRGDTPATERPGSALHPSPTLR